MTENVEYCSVGWDLDAGSVQTGEDGGRDIAGY